MKLAIIGFGSVGQGFVTVLRDKGNELENRYGFAPKITAVVTKTRGAVYHPAGLDPEALLKTIGQGTLAGYPDTPGLRRDLSGEDVTADPNVDVLLELSTTNLETGQPALDYCYRALDHGKHIVLANKGPVALAYKSLMERARAANRRVLFEGTVMSGTPSLRLAMESLAGCTITRVRGILNGTTNYILTAMEQGQSFDEALAEAQQLGYAEADASADLDGWDAAAKLMIFANVLFGASLTVADMSVRGIRGLTPADMTNAVASDCRWKLIADATPEVANVEPAKIALSDPLAGITGASNAVTFTTDLLGDVTMVGAGAGSVQTGFAVLSDLLSLHRGKE